MPPESLLGSSVRHRGLRLGVVTAVLVDETRGVTVGMEIAIASGGEPRFLPLPAARLAEGHVEASPNALLSREQAAFYQRHGARRLVRAASVA